MRQLQLIAHGEPSDVIELNTVSEPALGQEDVLISMGAAPLNLSLRAVDYMSTEKTRVSSATEFLTTCRLMGTNAYENRHAPLPSGRGRASLDSHVSAWLTGEKRNSSSSLIKPRCVLDVLEM